MSGSPSAGGDRRARLLVSGTVLLLLVVGVCLRLQYLDDGSFFIDEAESSLNALTILEHGYPSDHYLGLPMFENTLTEPWPESAEYEFRDTSYSSRGMAIYHGWLPLYAIAASFVLHGIHPDHVTDPPAVQHDDAEIHARIRAARLPSVAFALLFLLAMFLAGKALYGVDAGLCALLAASLAPKCIWLAQQARYYSAALALSTLAIYCAWMVCRRGRWRDFLLSALVAVLLFHTSSLAFVIALTASLVLLPRVLRHEHAPRKLAAWALVLALGLVPWMLWSGYLEHGGRIPMARSLLSFPADYFVYLSDRPMRAVAGCAVAAAAAGLWLIRRRLPARLAEPLASAGFPVLFLVVWTLAAYFGFQLLVPAASCALSRLSHSLIAAPILLGSIGLSFVARTLWRSGATPLAVTAMLGLLAATGNVLHWQRRNPYESQAAFELVDHLRSLALRADTKLYALPYQHFCLTFYTGLPIQSIAPVRRAFLDDYPGEIVILETTNRMPQPPWEWVQRFARREGVQLTAQQAQDWVPLLHARMIRAEVAPLVHTIQPEPDPVPPWVEPVVAALVEETRSSDHGYIDFSTDNPAMFRGYARLTIAEFWPVFFYRFVGPEERRGSELNYAGRMREADALLLPSTWLVLRCPAREAPTR